MNAHERHLIGNAPLVLAQEWMRALRQTEITVDCDLNITVTTEFGQRSWKVRKSTVTPIASWQCVPS